MSTLFVVVLRYIVPIKQVDAHRPEHLEFLDREYAKGTFIVSGGQVPRTGGVVLAKADSRTSLLEILKKDPFHRENLAEYQVFEFTVTRSAELFKPILAT
jgi:uncharacterized protein YciI